MQWITVVVQELCTIGRLLRVCSARPAIVTGPMLAGILQAGAAQEKGLTQIGVFPGPMRGFSPFVFATESSTVHAQAQAGEGGMVTDSTNS
jgi:hypothetical protein